VPLVKAIVAATDPLHPAGQALLESAGFAVRVPSGPSAGELARVVASADALIVRSKVTAEIVEAGTRLRGIVRHGAGLDFIPMDRANALAIPVAYVPGANAESVAEYVFAAVFAVMRRLERADGAMRAQSWAAAREPASRARELRGRTLGVIGLGHIGRRVAEIGHFGFAMKVIGHQRRRDAMPGFVTPADRQTVFSESDFIVLACPLTEETRHFVNAPLLSHVRKGAWLINVARGALIEEAALVAALSAGSLAGAVLDVFAEQPLPDDHPYRALPNVLLTPHFAGLTADSLERLSCGACEEAIRILKGERPLHLANPEIWERRRR